jgi:hypothetical protein
MRLCFSLLPQARQEKLKTEKEAGLSMREDLLQQKERKKGLAEVRGEGGAERDSVPRDTRKNEGKQG